MMFTGDGGTVLLPVRPAHPPFPVGFACGALHQTGNGMVLTHHHPMMNRRVHMQPPPPPPPQCHSVCPIPYALPPPQPKPRTIEVRDVWATNFHDELSRIGGLLDLYPFVCIDTEFPGTVHDFATPRHLRTAGESYALVKRNVDELQLLQLGLALFGRAGRYHAVWQFNFAGFDEARDPHSPTSISMLKAHGMDFPELRRSGIDPRVFAGEFCRSVLGRRRDLTWVAFAGSYDFAYLAKVLGRGRPLPEKLEEFREMVGRLFGPRVLDVKYIARFCGIRGGLEQVAAELGVKRAAGRAHNAGSDSLLTADVLRVMADQFFTERNVYEHAGKIEGLAVL